MFTRCAPRSTLFTGVDPWRSGTGGSGAGVPSAAGELATLTELATALDALQSRSPRRICRAGFGMRTPLIPFQNSAIKSSAGWVRAGSARLSKWWSWIFIPMNGWSLCRQTVRHQEDGKRPCGRIVRFAPIPPTHNLSTIHEIAPEWRANDFVALLKWIEECRYRI
ncbi:MAG: hypothetical protein IPL99_26325 [Candidatus Competibacteraceae bacterium]|nr:hypothetical protein [Candidatus Competibacteraceae bacterium]